MLTLPVGRSQGPLQVLLLLQVLYLEPSPWSHITGEGEADGQRFQAPSEVVALVQLVVNQVWSCCSGGAQTGVAPQGTALSLLWSPSFPRDDAFSDSLSQKADSEASSGPLLDDKASSKNDIQSPTDHIMDYGFGGVMGR